MNLNDKTSYIKHTNKIREMLQQLEESEQHQRNTPINKTTYKQDNIHTKENLIYM